MRYKERPLSFFFFFFNPCSVPSLLVHTQPHLNLAFEVSTERFTCVSGPEEEILSSPLHPHIGSMDFHTTSVSSTHVPSVLLIFIRTKETPTSALKTILCVGFFLFSFHYVWESWRGSSSISSVSVGCNPLPTRVPLTPRGQCLQDAGMGRGTHLPGWINEPVKALLSEVIAVTDLAQGHGAEAASADDSSASWPRRPGGIL